MPEALILFDIDGTLLNTGGAGIAALHEAFADEFPEQAARMPQLDLAGATDSGLVMSIFNHAEIDHSDHNRDRYYAAYLRRLGQNLAPAVVGIVVALAPVERHHHDRFRAIRLRIQQEAESSI